MNLDLPDFKTTFSLQQYLESSCVSRPMVMKIQKLEMKAGSNAKYCPGRIDKT